MSYIPIGGTPNVPASLSGCCGHCSSGLQQGMALFRCFHRFPEAEIIRRPCHRVIPRVLVKLGQLRGLIYSSDRGEQGRDRTYIHFMKTPPLLACDPAGKQLYLLGGNYQVTQRGIEG